MAGLVTFNANHRLVDFSCWEITSVYLRVPGWVVNFTSVCGLLMVTPFKRKKAKGKERVDDENLGQEKQGFQLTCTIGSSG